MSIFPTNLSADDAELDLDVSSGDATIAVTFGGDEASVDTNLSDGAEHFDLSLDASDSRLDANFGVVHEIHVGEGDPYRGEYVVIPKAAEEQTLATKNKTMLDNVTVTAIPYYETHNESGYTVFIASEV